MLMPKKPVTKCSPLRGASTAKTPKSSPPGVHAGTKPATPSNARAKPNVAANNLIDSHPGAHVVAAGGARGRQAAAGGHADRDAGDAGDHEQAAQQRRHRHHAEEP